MENNEDILKSIYLFSNFDRKELTMLAGKVKHVVLNTHETLFSEGNEATAFYVVRYGSLKIMTSTSGGDDIKLATIAAGDHFGELPFLDPEKRAATVEALEKTELLEITYTDLEAVLKSSKDTEMKFYKEISHFLVKRMRLLTHDLTYAKELHKSR